MAKQQVGFCGVFVVQVNFVNTMSQAAALPIMVYQNFMTNLTLIECLK